MGRERRGVGLREREIERQTESIEIRCNHL